MSTPNNIQEKDYRPFYTKTLFKILILLIVIFSLSVPATAQKDYGACLIKDGQFYGIHENKYFPMNSVMKFPQALFVADWMQRNNIRLSDSVKVTKEELIEGTWSPKLGDIKISQSFTYAELISYSLMLSDNNACDVLFRQCGAPKDVESYIRELGFKRVNVLFSALTRTSISSTFVASNLKFQDHAKERSELSGGVRPLPTLQ